MLNRIESLKASLRKSERRVADYIQAHPDITIRASLPKLARTIGVSQPTIIRFCQAIGYRGFREFKLNLAQTLARNPPCFHQGVLDKASEPDRPDPFTRTIGDLLYARDKLSCEAIQRAADLLLQCRRLECYATDIAATSALEAQRLFLRHGKPCVTYSDATLLSQAARLLGPGDAVLVIAAGTCSSALLKAVRRAQTCSAAIIAIAAPANPLTRLSEVLLELATDSSSDTARRIVTWLILETLAETMTAPGHRASA